MFWGRSPLVLFEGAVPEQGRNLIWILPTHLKLQTEMLAYLARCANRKPPNSGYEAHIEHDAFRRYAPHPNLKANCKRQPEVDASATWL